MKVLRYVVAAVLVLGGIALLAAPLRATAADKGAGFVPTRFTVTDSGKSGGPDLVLIPGLASSKAVWDGEATLLAPNFRLHVVQVGGFAGAAAGANASGEILPGLVEELHEYIAGAKMHPAVMGHSMGGLLGLMLAEKHPEDVSKLVIVDTLPFYATVFNQTSTPNTATTVESVRPMATAFRQQFVAMPDDQFAAMQPMMVGSMVKDKEGQRLVAASSVASDRKVFANAMYEDLQTDLRGEVGKIKTPALLLYPYDAELMGPDPAKVDALYKGEYKGMPNLKLVRIDGSRHFIMYDQPAKLDAAVEAFLK